MGTAWLLLAAALCFVHLCDAIPTLNDVERLEQMYHDRLHTLNAQADAKSKLKEMLAMAKKRDQVFVSQKSKPTLAQTKAQTKVRKETYSDMRLRTILEQSHVDPNDFLKVNAVTLANGITLIHQKDSAAPLLSVIFAYHVGSRHENERTQGVAHLLEHMMFKGTHTRPLQWGRLFYVLGSATNAFTTYGMTAYFHTIHKSALEPLVELEMDRMKNITLSEEQFNKEKKVVMSELTGDRNNPIMILNEKVMEAAYRGFWPGRSVGGKSVMDLTRKDALDFYSAGYRPGCLSVVVVGDIDFADLVRILDRSGLVSLGLDNLHEFAKCEFQIPKPVAVTLRPGYDVATQQDHKVIIKDSQAPMAVLEYVVPLCSLLDLEDVAPLQVLEVVLNSGVMMGGVESVGGEAGVMANFEEDAGWMAVLAAAPDPDFNSVLQLDEALSGDTGVFSRLRANVSSIISPDMVADAIRALVDAQRMEWFSSLESTAVNLAVDQTITGDYLYTQRLLNRTKKVTVEDIGRVLNKYFLKERFVVGTLSAGTQQETVESEKKYGEVEKFTDHKSVNNTADYFRSIQCHVPTADEVLNHVASLRYRDEFTADLPGGETRSKSVPMAPPLCFDEPDNCRFKQSFKPLRPMYLKLKNGMQLLAQEDLNLDDTDSTFIYGYVDAGMEYDPVDYEGTSLMTALTLQLNLQMYSIAKITNMETDQGNSSINGSTSAPQWQAPNHASFEKLIPEMTKSIQGIPELAIAPQLEGMLIHGETDCGGLETALEALHFALTSAQMLSASEHQQLQSMLSSMMSSMASDPSYLIRRTLLEQLFPADHPQMRSPTSESINRIPIELVQKFYINRVCPETVKIAVVSGQYSSDATSTINRMAELFEKWPPCSKRPRPQRNTTEQTSQLPQVGAGIRNAQDPVKNMMDMWKKIAGKSDDDIKVDEARVIENARNIEMTVKAGLTHGSQIVANAIQNIVPGAATLLSPFSSETSAKAPYSGFTDGINKNILDSTLSHVMSATQTAGQVLLQEQEQSSTGQSGPVPDMPDKPSLNQPGAQTPILDQLTSLIGASPSEFLTSLFGPTTSAEAWTKFARNPEVTLANIDIPRMIVGFNADGGFGFLDSLTNFKKQINSFASTQVQSTAKDASDGAVLTNMMSATHNHHQPLSAKLPKFMQSLADGKSTQQQQTKHASNRADNAIPGLSKMRPRIQSMDDVGSVIALSWLDIAKSLAHSALQARTMGVVAGSIGDQALSSVHLQESVLATGLMNIIDVVNTRLLSKPGPTFSQMSGRAPEADSGKSLTLGEVEKQMYFKVEEQMNSVRGKLEQLTGGLVSENLVQTLRAKAEDIKTHPFYLPSLHQLNEELSSMINRLEGKVSSSSLKSIASQYQSLQPNLAQLSQQPEGDSGKLGSNSEPEPSRGGAFGMFELPDIPAEPYYPPPKVRKNIVWIRRKVPGLHEAITVMVSDTIVHSNKDLVAAMVGNHILGGNSLSGKLGYWVRDCKGLTYHIASQMDIGQSSSLFMIQMQTQTGAALDQAVNDTLHIMQDIKKRGFTQAEMNSAKRNLVAMANIHAADSRAVTQKIMMDMVYAQRNSPDGSEDTNMYTGFTQRLVDLTLKDLNRTAKYIFRPNRIVILSLAEDLEDDFYPSPDLDSDYVTPPDPKGTTPAGNKDGDCRESPAGEDANPYRAGEPGLYVPPPVDHVEPHVTRSVMHSKVDDDDDLVQDTVPQSMFRRPSSALRDMLQNQQQIDEQQQSESEKELYKLQDNIKSLGSAGLDFVNKATGGMVDQAGHIADAVWSQLHQPDGIRSAPKELAKAVARKAMPYVEKAVEPMFSQDSVGDLLAKGAKRYGVAPGIIQMQQQNQMMQQQQQIMQMMQQQQQLQQLRQQQALQMQMMQLQQRMQPQLQQDIQPGFEMGGKTRNNI